ncbi:MAG: cation transporter, partial [Coriobacteriales bacterium]|nr:cation transporter [Coriobacteriales bacterium]
MAQYFDEGLMTEARTTTLTVRGMSCVACEQRIARMLAPLPGVAAVAAHFESNTVELTFDGEAATLVACTEALATAHYPVADSTGAVSLRRLFSAIALVLAALAGSVLLQRSGIFTAFPLITQQMSLPVLFLVGLSTSIHCVAMCGGI